MTLSLAFSLLVFGLMTQAGLAEGFARSQCKEYPITKGANNDSDGIIRYCDNGTDQRVYVSGEMDSEDQGKRTEQSLRSVLAKIKKRKIGKFEMVTRNAGGGDVDLHQKLIMAVEDACTGDCKITTEVHGYCESACNQLHITCVGNSNTIIHPGGKTCEHATSGGDGCNRCDSKDPRKCDICGPKESISEYKDRCGKLLRGRNVKADENRKKQIYGYVEALAAKKVFDTSEFSCHRMPWAELLPAFSGSHPPAELAR